MSVRVYMVVGKMEVAITADEIGEMTYNTDYIGKYKGRYILRGAIQELMNRWQIDVLVYPHETKPARTIADAVPGGGELESPPQPREVGNGNRLSTATALPTILVPIAFNTPHVHATLAFPTNPYH